MRAGAAWAFVLSATMVVAAPVFAHGQSPGGLAIGGVGGDETSGPAVFWYGSYGWGAFAEWREGVGPNAPVRSRWSLGVTRNVTNWFAVYAGGGLHTAAPGMGVHPAWGLLFRPHPNVVLQLAGADGSGGAGLGVALGTPVYSAMLRALSRRPDVSRIHIGMSADAVRRELGRPRRIHTIETPAARSEQWEYGRGVYVYLIDGVVTAVQRIDGR